MFMKEKRKNIQYLALKNIKDNATKSLDINCNIFQISLRKSPIGLGFTLGTIESKEKDQNEIFVKMILDFSPAKYDGRLRVGDRIKKINNLDVQTMTQADLVRIIRSIPIGEVIGLTVSRSAIPDNQLESINKEIILLTEDEEIHKPLTESKSKIFHFIIAVSNDMDKACYSQGSAGILGISVECRDSLTKDFSTFSENSLPEKDQKLPLTQKNFYIKSILKNGSAHQDGRLKVGDEIIAVQGIDIKSGKIYIVNSTNDIYGDIFHFDLPTVFIRNLEKLCKLSEFNNQFKMKSENPLYTLKLIIKEAGEMYSSISIVIRRNVSVIKGKLNEKLIHQSYDSSKKKLNDLYRIENIFELNPDYRSNYNDLNIRENRYKYEEFNEIHGRYHQERFITHVNSDNYEEDFGFGLSLDTFYHDDYENERPMSELSSNGKEELFAYFSKEEEPTDEWNENNNNNTNDNDNDCMNISDPYSYEPSDDIA